MSLFRPTTLLSRTTRQLRFSSPIQYRPFTATTNLLSVQGYGDGKGDPKGSDPEAQGHSSKASHEAQHPGPAAPKEGQGTGNATKGSSTDSKATGTYGGRNSGQKDPAEASAQSGGSRSKEAKETGSSPTGGAIGKRNFSTSTRWRTNDEGGQVGAEKNAKKGGDVKDETKKPQVNSAKPKILDSESGEGVSDEKKAEVEAHNKEFEKGHDRAGRQDSKPRDEKK